MTLFSSTASRLLLALALIAAASLTSSVLQAQSTVTAAPLSAPPVTREQAIAAARASTAIAQRIDQIDAKLTTFSELQAARNASNETFAGFSPGQEIWVVAIRGDFVPQLGRGVRGTWGVFLTDAVTGKTIGTLAGSDGSWPDFFARITDRAPVPVPTARP